MVLACFVLVLVDMVSGITAAKKLKNPITSAGLRRTLVKLLVYEAVILLAFLTTQYLTGPEVPLTNIAAGYFGLTEFLSIVENLNIISGNDLLKALLDKLGSANHNKQ